MSTTNLSTHPDKQLLLSLSLSLSPQADSIERSYRGMQVLLRILRNFLAARQLSFTAREIARGLAGPGAAARVQQIAGASPEDEFLKSLGMQPLGQPPTLQGGYGGRWCLGWLITDLQMLQ